MKDTQTVYIGIDLHSNTSTIGYMNQQGEYCGHRQLETTPVNLINQITAIPGQVKKATLEQSNMAFWAAELLQDHVDELIICDPRHNALVSAGENKNDGLDAMNLCTLLRLNRLKEVWRPKQMGLRRLFFYQVKEYHRLTKSLSIHKRQLQRVEKTGSSFWEIKEFLKIPGIGPVGAHTFSGYIQTPHRFRRAGQLIKYCKLAVRKFTSDGKAVRSERLSKAGHGRLKNLAHICWKSSSGSDNEVSRYFQDCLACSGNEVHARLATQRKILITMWALWKNEQPYDPTKFIYTCEDSIR